MTAIQTEYRFTAKITGKAETPGGTPYLQFDWKLPGDQYAFQLLLGQEKDVYEAWNPGQVATVIVTQGPLKSGKNGNYARDYFWNVESIGEGVGTMPEPDRHAPENTHRQPQTGPPANPSIDYHEDPDRPLATTPPKDDIQVRIEKGMAFNAAYTLAANDPVFGRADWDSANTEIRLLRDRLYHEVILVPIAPEHFCYIHETTHHGNEAGVYGHRDGDGWCMEDAPVAPEANGEPTPAGSR